MKAIVKFEREKRGHATCKVLWPPLEHEEEVRSGIQGDHYGPELLRRQHFFRVFHKSFLVNKVMK